MSDKLVMILCDPGEKTLLQAEQPWNIAGVFSLEGCLMTVCKTMPVIYLGNTTYLKISCATAEHLGTYLFILRTEITSAPLSTVCPSKSNNKISFRCPVSVGSWHFHVPAVPGAGASVWF